MLIGAGAVLALGLAGDLIKNRLWIAETTVCCLVGIILGPHVTGLADLSQPPVAENVLVKEMARVTLALAIMAAADGQQVDFGPLARGLSVVASTWALVRRSLPAFA